jgi:hypothetical protein
MQVLLYIKRQMIFQQSLSCGYINVLCPLVLFNWFDHVANKEEYCCPAICGQAQTNVVQALITLLWLNKL